MEFTTEQDRVDAGWTALAQAAIDEDKAKLAEVINKGPSTAFKKEYEIYSKIAAALVLAGVNATATASEFKGKNAVGCNWEGWTYPQLHIDGLHMNPVDVKEDRTGGWRQHGTGKWSVSVGTYGNRTRYPQRKDGDHNYDAIVNQIMNMLASKKSEDKAQAQRVTNTEALNRFMAETKMERFGIMSVNPSTYADNPLSVQVNFNRSMKVEDAVALFKALKNLGLVKENTN